MTSRTKYRLEVGFLLGLAIIVALVEGLVAAAAVLAAIERAW